MATSPRTITLDDSRVSRAGALARSLEHDIVDGALAPGERLGTKEQLRVRFGVAVATVNEAIRMLEMRGLVEARPGPGGGVFVAAPSARVRLSHLVLGFKWEDADYSDCLVVRNALEPLVCRDAARRGDAADIRGLDRTVDAMEAAARDAAEFLRLNWQLHREIARLCRNAPLQTIYLTLLDFVEQGLEEVAPDPDFDASTSVEAHRALVAAIASRDASTVDEALTRHQPFTAALGG